MKTLNLIIAVMLSFTSLIAQPPPIDMYISKQTGEHCGTMGAPTFKSTDKYEHGCVTPFTTGPIKEGHTPNDNCIDINQTKIWLGWVTPDVAAAPPPGHSAPATLKYDYDVHYSRPKQFPGGVNFPGGVITSEKVEGKYACGGCWYHPVADSHYLIHKIGSISQDFNVHSIKVSFKKKMYKVMQKDTKIIQAICYPATGGSVTWTKSNNKIQIVAQNGNKVKIKGKNPGNCTLTATVTFCGNVKYKASVKIRVFPRVTVKLRSRARSLPPPQLLRVECVATGNPGGGTYQWTFSNPELLHGYGYSNTSGNSFWIINKPANSMWISIKVKYTKFGFSDTKIQKYYLAPAATP